MIVIKFGGTSVKDAGSLSNAANTVKHNANRKPIVVLSAGADVTDALIDIAGKATGNNSQPALEKLGFLRERHSKTAKSLLTGDYLNTAEQIMVNNFRELERLVDGISILRELTPRVLDYFVSFGEQWSCLLLEQKLLQDGYDAVWVDSRKVLITDNDFTKAKPLFDFTEKRAREHILPLLHKNKIIITQGFIGSTRDGITTTLGRGGSDYTAAILGSLLEAVEIQIRTDVSGVLTANPKIIPDARPVREMTFNEAAELAYFGAKVLHPYTILPVVKKKIPIRVLDSNRPDDEGTLITVNNTNGQSGVSSNGEVFVKSIAYRTDISIIRIQSTRRLMANGFLAKVFAIFARYEKSIDLIAPSEAGISLTIDDKSRIDNIIAELRELAEVRVINHKAVLSIVGENIKNSNGIAGRAFTALDNAGVNVELISHGGSEINLTFVISEEQIKPALLALHEEFFGKEKQKGEEQRCEVDITDSNKSYSIKKSMRKI